jgi:hypothetical protein
MAPGCSLFILDFLEKFGSRFLEEFPIRIIIFERYAIVLHNVVIEKLG